MKRLRASLSIAFSIAFALLLSLNAAAAQTKKSKAVVKTTKREATITLVRWPYT